MIQCLGFRERERLQVILKEKKNRKWSILEALKDVMASISSRFRREAKPGVNLEKLIEQMENHEVGTGTANRTTKGTRRKAGKTGRYSVFVMH